MNSPSVSICVPVYNGEKHVGAAVQSILEQSWEDFELIISDNASTDGTQAICREASARDQRVRYFRSNVNRGLARNYNRAFGMAKGRYVVWIGHDDRMAAEYIRRCVETLENDREAVLCFSNALYIDDKGNLIKKVELRNDGAFDSPSDRFKNVMRYDHKCDAVFGLMRKETLQQTRLHGGFADSDRVLLAEMGLRGRFQQIAEPLFLRREHDQQATQLYDRWERTIIFDPRKAGKPIFPSWREGVEFFSAINRAPLPWKERLRCYRHLQRWLWNLRRYLWHDLLQGLKFSVRRHLSRDQVVWLKSTAQRFQGLLRVNGQAQR